MADYQRMYGILFRRMEQAINILIEAQRECEELYMKASDTKVELVPPDSQDES